MNKTQIKKHIAIWSSLPPLSCGVADYTAELVGSLSKYYNIEVFVDNDYLPDKSLLFRYNIHHHSAFDRREKQQHFDIVIYQIGATSYQDYMYDMIRKRPGIVVFHDLIMGLGFFYIYSEHKEMRKFRREFLIPEGEYVLQRFNKILKQAKTPPIKDLDELFREHYILKWVMNNSLAQIVHLKYFKDVLERKYANSNAYVASMGVRDMKDKKNIRSTRSLRVELAIPTSKFLIGIFGSVVRVKRIESCLRALKKFIACQPNTLLVIIGSQLQPDYFEELCRLITHLELESYVQFTGRTSGADFDKYFLACDVILNLRYPTYHGMSAILARAFAAGKPVIISDIPEWSEFPEEFCWRVQPDESEVDQITEFLARATRDPELLSDASMRSRQYFLQNGTLGHMAEKYYQIIEQVTSK